MQEEPLQLRALDKPVAEDQLQLRPLTPPEEPAAPPTSNQPNEPMGAMGSLLYGVDPMTFGKRILGAASTVSNYLLPAGSTPRPNATPELGPQEDIGAKAATLGAIPGTLGTVKDLVKGALPSTERAGQNFQRVMGATKDVPVDLSKVDPIVERAKELRTHGHTPPSMAMRQYNKMQQPQEFGPYKIDPEPMNYQTARDFAVSAGDQSAKEITGINRTMKRQNKSFAKALDDANREAAYKAGRGEIYDAAMAEYRSARRLQKAKELIQSEAAKKAIAGLGIGAAGVATGAAIYHYLGE